MRPAVKIRGARTDGYNSMKRTLISLLIFLPALLWADRKEGVMAEYRQLEETIRGKARSADSRQKTLEENLLRAMRSTVVRVDYDKRETLLKDVSIANISFENPTSSLVYYVKFKNFLIRLDYARDPELYSQTPMYEKLLIADDKPAKEPAKEPAKQPEKK